MTPLDRLLIERECIRLAVDFAISVDRREYDRFVRLFTPDGVFARAGGTFRGAEELRAFLDARRSDMVTRHVYGTMRIEVEDDTRAGGVCYAQVFQAAGAESAGTLEAAPPKVVEYVDRFLRGPGGWRIESRTARIVLSVSSSAA